MTAAVAKSGCVPRDRTLGKVGGWARNDSCLSYAMFGHRVRPSCLAGYGAARADRHTLSGHRRTSHVTPAQTR